MECAQFGRAVNDNWGELRFGEGDDIPSQPEQSLAEMRRAAEIDYQSSLFLNRAAAHLPFPRV